MRRRVLCGCWARLAFLRAREKKALVVVVAKTDEATKEEYCWRDRSPGLVGAGDEHRVFEVLSYLVGKKHSPAGLFPFFFGRKRRTLV